MGAGDWQPATQAEAALLDALIRDDQDSYFRVLTGIELLLPVTAEALAGQAPMGWGTWTSDDRTHLLTFTSAASMRACLGDRAGAARQIPFTELAAAWPNEQWWLAVDPGLPIEGYLPPWFVTQLGQRGTGLSRDSSRPRGRLERLEALERAKAARDLARSKGGVAERPAAVLGTRPSALTSRREHAAQPARVLPPRTVAGPRSGPPPDVRAQVDVVGVPSAAASPAPPPPDAPAAAAVQTGKPLPSELPPLPALPEPPALPRLPEPEPPALPRLPEPEPPALPRLPEPEPSRWDESIPRRDEPEPDRLPIDDSAGEPGFTPANNVESQLLDATRAGNTDSFLSTLLLSTVLLRRPAWADETTPGQDGFEWDPEVEEDGGRYVVCYTSEQSMPSPGRTAPIRFIKLISVWPDPKWSLSVNPGTAIATTLPGDELLALANWATDAGLVADDDEAAAHPEVPKRTGPEVTVMQKAIAPSQVSYYLEREYDRVSGFVHRTHEVEHLRTPAQLRSGLGLIWQGSPFSEDADEIYVLRWPAYRPNLYRIPYGGANEQAMQAMEGWVIERAPFRGNGFAPGDSRQVIAEFKVDSARLPHGTRLTRITADGTEQLVAVLDADGPRWRRVTADEQDCADSAGGA